MVKFIKKFYSLNQHQLFPLFIKIHKIQNKFNHSMIYFFNFKPKINIVFQIKGNYKFKQIIIFAKYIKNHEIFLILFLFFKSLNVLAN